MELQHKYRANRLSDLIGLEETGKILRRRAKEGSFPHAFLLSGPSGCGKTTIARIIARYVKCNEHDLIELNNADIRGIDAIRDIRQVANLEAIGGGESRVWIIDEAHQLTSHAQDAFLKILEEPPSHVYFILCTTDPNKLKKTIRTRCTDLKVRLLKEEEINELIDKICEKEDIDLEEEAIEKIIEIAEGSPRKVLVMLDSLLGVPKENQADAVQSATDIQKYGIDLARLLHNPRTKWKQVAEALKHLEDEPETVRRIVLGFAFKVLLSGNGRAYLVIEAFQDNFFDSGKAGLAAACFEVIHSK